MEYYIDPVTFVTQKSGFESRYIKNLLGLLDEGATIPVSYTHLTLPTKLEV